MAQDLANKTKYSPHLLQLVNYLDESNLTNIDQVTQERLLELTAKDICRFLTYKAYGTDSPGNEDFPNKLRSNTILYYKKAISWFMPRRLIQWDPINLTGNPTQSEELSVLIKNIKKAESRKQGAVSRRKRSLTMKEFISVIEVCRKMYFGERHKRWLFGAVYCLQWHLMGRNDDMMKLMWEDVEEINDFPFALGVRVKWSKNVIEEREIPKQIILGSMDPRLCCLLNLACFIESVGIFAPEKIISTEESTNAKFIFLDPQGHEKNRRVFSRIVNHDDFKMEKPEKPAVHSIRKGPTTYCAKLGFTKEQYRKRGRWRTRKEPVDTYVDMELPVPDATLANALCGPLGACQYKLGVNAEALTKEFV